MRRLLAAALVLPSIPAAAETPDQVARRYKLAGELLVANGDKVALDKGYGTIDPQRRARHRAGARWRLASITKQIVAVQVVRDAGRQGVSLDAPTGLDVGRPVIGSLTRRQLLTHHSGLANPDATPGTAGGVPSFYRRAQPDLAYCWSRAASPGADFSYNNCDYIALGALLSGEGRIDPDRRWPGMRLARPGERGLPGYVAGRPEPAFELASFGTAGALIGSARALFKFDRELMTGRLLSPAARAQLWQPEGGRSYQALGQWVFPGRLKGCAAAKRIVQRDGEIGGVQTRNYILPDDDLVVIVFTNRSPDDFPMGEVWQGQGFAYDLLSAAACP